MVDSQARFVSGSTMGHVVRMTLTGAVGLTFMFLIDAANLFWIAYLGVERLVAALGFAWTIQFFAVSSGIGLMIGVTATVSRSIGGGDRPEARRQVTVSAIAATLVQVLVAGVIIYFRHEILALAGAKGQTALDAARYLTISITSLPLMALGMVGTAVLRAEGDAYRAMMVALVSGLISMVIDPLLIVWLDLGLVGAAYAIVFARVMSAMLAFYYVVRVHDLVGRISLSDVARLIRPFLMVAVPAIMTQLSTPFGNYILTRVIAGFGDGAVAGWAVVGRLTVLAFGGIFSLSGAIGGIFGQNFGAGRPDRVKRTYRDALVFCLGYVMLAWLMLASFSEFAVSAFQLGPDGAQVVRAFTIYAAGAFVFAGALFVANSAFNNLGRPIYSTLFNWTRDGILLWPAAALLSGHYAASGVIYGQAAAGVVAGTLAGVMGWLFVSRLVAANETAQTSL